MNHHKKKVYVQHRYVDVETGEIISKSQKERMYYIIKNKEFKTIEIEDHGGYIVKTTTHGCRKTGRINLFS